MPWSEPPALLAVAAIALFVSAAGSGLAIRHAHRRGLLDQPGARRSHRVPTPRGGGIGIVAACLLALWMAASAAPTPGAWGCMALGLLLVAGIGWWDDHRPLPAWPRLLAHAVAAVALACSIHLQGGGPALAAVAFVLTLVLVNAWNFMDGINGMACSQALLCAIGFAMLGGEGARLLAVALAAACLGFLPFNFPRAHIFLGDVGSGALGYLLAALVAMASLHRPSTDWPVLLLPPMAMLADSGLTLLRRMRRRERWWQPHVQHAYQRWSRVQGHAAVTMAYALWTFAAVAIMLVAVDRPVWMGLASTVAIAALSAWTWHRLQRHCGTHTEGFGS